MNRKQLILLFLALVVIGGAGLVLFNRQQESWSEPQGKMGRKLLPNFKINDVAMIHIKDEGELHLERKDGLWRVRERGDYPANFSQISDLLMKIYGLKISQSEPIGPSQLAHMDLEPPGKGAGSGTLLELKDAQGKATSSLLLGKKHMQESARPSPFGEGGFADGRYVMLTDAGKDLLLISDALTEVDAKGDAWLNRDFFKVEKPDSISLVSTNATNSWKLTRAGETAPWTLEDARAGERLDSNKVSSLAGTLSYPSFVDVATNTAPGQTGLDHPLVVTITTFDHFTYTLKIGHKTPENNYDANIAVTADIPTRRTAGKDEKPDDKKKLDEEFQSKTKTLQDKLKQEQSFGRWVYVVNAGLLDPLIRSRAQLFVDKKEKKPAEKTAAESSAEPGAEGATNADATLESTHLPAVAPPK